MKGLSNLKSIDKNTFELLDNLLKFSLDDIYITRDDFFINNPEYCISNYNGKLNSDDDDDDDDTKKLFQIKLSTEYIKIEIKKDSAMVYINMIYNGNGLKNKSKTDLNCNNIITNGNISYDKISPEIYNHFKPMLEERVTHYREIEIKSYENSIYKILNIDRRVKIDKIIKD